MAALPWVSELLAAEHASRATTSRAGRLLGCAAVAACIAMVFITVQLISMSPRATAYTAPLAIITSVLFLIFAIWGALLHRRAATLRKHALALYNQHGPLTTANTTLTQLQTHLGGWTVARDTPRSLHLLHQRTPTTARLIKFSQVLAGISFCTLFAIIISHYGWSLAGMSTGVSSFKIKLIVYALPVIGILLPLIALVPSPVQLLMDRDANDELLLESVSLRGTHAQMLPLSDITSFVVNEAVLFACVTPPARVMLLEFSLFEAMKTSKPLKPLHDNITTLRKQLLHDAFTRVSSKPVEIL